MKGEQISWNKVELKQPLPSVVRNDAIKSQRKEVKGNAETRLKIFQTQAELWPR